MPSEIRVKFPGNKKVSAEFDGYQLMTDQPRDAGGDGAAPAPFDVFLASLGTCAGIFVLSFCQKRGIATEGLEIVQTMEWNEDKHLVSKVNLEIILPKGFPDKYKDSLVKTAELCTVKRHLHDPPTFLIKAV